MILILPIVVLQLAVAVMFLQRHYEDVTVQMTSNMAREIRLVRQDPSLAGALGITVGTGELTEWVRVWDLSARAMREELARVLPDLETVDTVSLRKTVQLGFADGTTFTFARSNVSASNPHQLLVLMVVTALIMTGISVLFLRGQIRPIRRLARAAEAFGRGQAVDYRPTGATEVRAAGTAFLDMRSRIERHIEQRTLLLSGVSHDLRTPLTRMKLELSMMDDEAATALSQDVDAMQRIIDTFLDFSRENAQDMRTEVNALALLQEAVDMVPAAKPILVHGQPVQAALYPDGVRRALCNLIANAIRYGSEVRVALITGQNALTFVVEDDGPGIPEAQREAAMRPFARLEEARTNTDGNVGLGLAIVRDVARAHGGALRLGASELGGLKAEIVVPI